MSDPKDPKADSAHPHGEEHAGELHDLPGFDGPAAADPMAELGFHTSSEEFHFTGPAEELDFTEPSDFTFPSEATAAEHDFSSSHIGHAGAETLFGDEPAHEAEAAAHHDVVDTELAGDELAEGAVALEEAEAAPKRKREVPAWVRKAEWALIIGLPVIALILNIVSINYFDPSTIRLIFNISYPVLLALIPYALWRSKDRWTTPAVTAAYTVMLSLGTAMLLTGTWFLGTELSRLNWEIKKATVKAAAAHSAATAAAAMPKVQSPPPDASAATP